jgi:formylglycine-generating enzyme required for sulfatase activity/tRNA A-37 threonylcarbamoyl transferase component Bud32
VHCQNCGNAIPDGSTVCPLCQKAALPSAPAVATGALTPPDGLAVGAAMMTTPGDAAAPPPAPAQLDALAERLQAAIGDQYKVERTLGAGGFAVVYLVRDLNLKRKLAVKVLSPDLITSKTVLERFRREAETVAQLSHPHIVPLHFIGQKEDLLYLAMECIDGGARADRIEREGKLPVDEVARILREVAGALDHAHRRGVIHRDIKPHNVLIEAETGRSLVTDFGIARTAEGSSLTASGMMVGTPAYLSPEQVTGATADHRADLYALGVMGYEMLTGQPPFTGPTPTAVLMKRLSGTPTPVGKLRADVPPVIADVIDGCLAQDPAERFQTGAEIVRALGGQTPTSGSHPTSEMRRRARKKSRMPLAVGGTVVGLLAVAGLVSIVVRGGGPVAPSGPVVPPGTTVVPSGTYVVGTDNGQAAARPAHQVVLQPFAIERTEVTVGAFKAFVDSTGFPAPWGAAMPDPRLPVTRVLWAEASNYCSWKYGNGGRLPTEEEWEAAARGLADRRYPWGDRWQPGRANLASARRNGPAPVGTYGLGATPDSILDLVGNVWEWTSSQLRAYPGGPALTASANAYVIRGGAFDTADSLAAPSYRGGPLPADMDRDLLARTGFRCVVPVTAVAPGPGR